MWNAAAQCYTKLVDKNADELFRAPHLIGLTRDQEARGPGTWVGALFDYHPPQMRFSQSQQRLLLAALSGMTDEKLSEALAVSPNTIRNTWRSIYERAASHLPEIFDDGWQPDSANSQRGKEKKRHLLTYLRKHLEELRPFTKK